MEIQSITLEEEIWKDIKDYVGYYQVSSFGRVKSLARTVSNGKSDNVFWSERMLIGGPDFKGYMCVKLSQEGVGKMKKIHQLVAQAFLGHTPCGMERVIDHIDTDKTNNHVSNLQVVSVWLNNTKDRVGNSGVTGVHITKLGDIVAHIKVNKKTRYLGVFDTIEQASIAYNEALELSKDGIIPCLKRTNKSGYLGVVGTPSNKYAARIRSSGQSCHIGVYTTPIEAARAYDQKAIELRGLKAKLNFDISDYITTQP